mgnify:FL=1
MPAVKHLMFPSPVGGGCGQQQATHPPPCWMPGPRCMPPAGQSMRAAAVLPAPPPARKVPCHWQHLHTWHQAALVMHNTVLLLQCRNSAGNVRQRCQGRGVLLRCRPWSLVVVLFRSKNESLVLNRQDSCALLHACGYRNLQASTHGAPQPTTSGRQLHLINPLCHAAWSLRPSCPWAPCCCPASPHPPLELLPLSITLQHSLKHTNIR